MDLLTPKPHRDKFESMEKIRAVQSLDFDRIRVPKSRSFRYQQATESSVKKRKDKIILGVRNEFNIDDYSPRKSVFVRKDSAFVCNRIVRQNSISAREIYSSHKKNKENRPPLRQIENDNSNLISPKRNLSLELNQFDDNSFSNLKKEIQIPSAARKPRSKSETNTQTEATDEQFNWFTLSLIVLLATLCCGYILNMTKENEESQANSLIEIDIIEVPSKSKAIELELFSLPKAIENELPAKLDTKNRGKDIDISTIEPIFTPKIEMKNKIISKDIEKNETVVKLETDIESELNNVVKADVTATAATVNEFIETEKIETVEVQIQVEEVSMTESVDIANIVTIDDKRVKEQETIENSVADAEGIDVGYLTYVFQGLVLSIGLVSLQRMYSTDNFVISNAPINGSLSPTLSVAPKAFEKPRSISVGSNTTNELGSFKCLELITDSATLTPVRRSRRLQTASATPLYR